MAVTCKEIMELEICGRLKLLGGADGLNKVVTWPYIKNMDTISEWINGGELIFFIGANEDVSEKGLLKLMDEADKNNISGVVMLIGEDYMKTIPKSVIKFADEHAIPLFKMPFLLKLIDITQEISRYLVRDKEKNRDFVDPKENTLLTLILSGKGREEQLAYCWKKLQPLTEADKVLKSEFVVTLHHFLNCNNDLLKASAHMFIHRNTLINRIRKIEGLLGVSVNEGSVRNEFYNIYKVLEYYDDI